MISGLIHWVIEEDAEPQITPLCVYVWKRWKDLSFYSQIGSVKFWCQAWWLGGRLLHEQGVKHSVSNDYYSPPQKWMLRLGINEGNKMKAVWKSLAMVCCLLVWYFTRLRHHADFSICRQCIMSVYNLNHSWPTTGVGQEIARRQETHAWIHPSLIILLTKFSASAVFAPFTLGCAHLASYWCFNCIFLQLLPLNMKLAGYGFFNGFLVNALNASLVDASLRVFFYMT